MGRLGSFKFGVEEVGARTDHASCHCQPVMVAPAIAHASPTVTGVQERAGGFGCGPDFGLVLSLIQY